MFIGLIFNLTLFGAMIVQTYFYFKGYKKYCSLLVHDTTG